MALEFKPLSREAVGPALERAEYYRLMNEPWEAESICHDVLAIEPDNQAALALLILALTDQFGDQGGVDEDEPKEIVARLSGEYEQAFYSGVICERQAKVLLMHGTLGSRPAVYDLLHEAMEWYDRAETVSTPGSDEALLRWNTCARLILRNRLRPPPGHPGGRS